MGRERRRIRRAPRRTAAALQGGCRASAAAASPNNRPCPALPRGDIGGQRAGQDLRLRARPPLRPAAARLPRAELRDGDREVLRRDLLLPFVSPLRRRVLFTVAAAIRFAVPLLRPRLFALRLIFSYCRSRLLLQELGIPSPLAPEGAKGASYAFVARTPPSLAAASAASRSDAPSTAAA